MFIISKKYGRLCNRLFNSAHVLASAIEHKHEFMNLAFYDYAHYFEATSNDVFCRYPIKSSFLQNNSWLGRLLYYFYNIVTAIFRFLKKIGINIDAIKVVTASEYPGGCNLDEVLFNSALSSNKLYFFQGFPLLGFNSLEKHGDKVRKYFAPTNQYQEKINSLINELRESNDLLIGVVVRHGDYREWQSGRYFYTLNEYSEIMQGLRELFPNQKVKFLICSDEEQNLEALKKFDYFFRCGYMIENLYSLAKCDYIISPPSTYGMWASFYGNVPLYIIKDLDKPLSINDFQPCLG